MTMFRYATHQVKGSRLEVLGLPTNLAPSPCNLLPKASGGSAL